MASRMIKRSKTVPLTVYIPFFGNCPKGFVSPESFDLFWSAVDNVLTQKARLVDLQLRCDVKTGAELHKLLNMMEKHTFPALHTLRIDMDDFEAPLFNSSMNIHGPFPWESFPSLQSLELYDVLVPPNIPPLPSLRNLLVDCTSRRDGTVCFSVNWALSFLQKTPNLEVLELNEITPYIPTPFPEPVLRVSLPNLLSLTVQGEEPSSAKIFDFIELPSHPIRVRFTSSTPEEDIGRSEDIIAPLATLCAGVASIHRDHGNPVSKIVMSARPSVSRFKVALFAPQETSSMVDLHIDGVSASHFFNLCSSSIPLNDVAEFVIEHNDTADRVTGWLGLLTSLSAARTLHFSSCNLSFVRRLVDAMSSQESPCPLPQLEVLSFVRMRWLSSEAENVGNSFESWFTLGVLEKFVQRRRERGRPMRRFCVHDCRILSHQITSLRRSIQVVWDGKDQVSGS